jgi:hypothetical protein
MDDVECDGGDIDEMQKFDARIVGPLVKDKCLGRPIAAVPRIMMDKARMWGTYSSMRRSSEVVHCKYESMRKLPVVRRVADSNECIGARERASQPAQDTFKRYLSPTIVQVRASKPRQTWRQRCCCTCCLPFVASALAAPLCIRQRLYPRFAGLRYCRFSSHRRGHLRLGS